MYSRLYDDMVQRIAKQQDNLFGDQKEFIYWYPGAQRIAEKASAPVKGKSHAIETTLNLTGKEEGVIVACGGFTGGYTLFIKNNKAYLRLQLLQWIVLLHIRIAKAWHRRSSHQV